MKRSDFDMRRYQRGLSLIELMIAMLIGSILILGITEIYINNQKSYLFQQSQIGNQENGRFTLALLKQELSKAGFRSLPSQLLVPSAGVVSGCSFPQGAAVVAISNVALCIQYQASNKTEVTCQGTALADTDKTVITKPYNRVNAIIVERIMFDKATQSITCTTGSTTQPLVTGVADFRFEYGSGGAKTVTDFGTSPAQTIGAVRFAALMQSGTSTIRDTTDTPKALTEWNSRFSPAITDNTKTYQIVQGTIMLRNQMP